MKVALPLCAVDVRVGLSIENKEDFTNRNNTQLFCFK